MPSKRLNKERSYDDANKNTSLYKIKNVVNHACILWNQQFLLDSIVENFKYLI